MRLGIVCFALGVWLLQQQAELPSLRFAFAVMLVLPAWGLAVHPSPSVRWTGRVALLPLACAAGFFWAATVAHVRLADALPAQWEARDVEVVGVVATLPQRFERSVRFELDLEQVLTPAARVPQRVMLSWWGRPSALPGIHAGERWRLTVRLKRPHGTANPHGFDYEAWLLEKGVRAVGYVKPRPSPERVSAFVHRPQYWVEAARERLRDRILRSLSGHTYAGVIAALAVGDQRAITPQQWETFSRTGVNHLMSISGLHVTMVAGLCYAIALLAWRRSTSLVLKLPAPKAAAMGGALGAFVYTLLSGFAVPAQRTLYMVCVVAVALWSGLKTSASVVLCAALFIVLVLDPWAVVSAGFWLSFGAVAAILFVVVNRVGQSGWFAAAVRTQAAVTVALLPLLLALFQQVSLISPVANAVAIPLVSLLVVPLALVGMLLPLEWLLQLAHGVMACCMLVLEYLSALPDAVWQQHAPVRWAIAAGVAASLWLLLPRGFPARSVGLVALLPLFLIAPAGLRPGDLQVAVLDVGQGLAVVVRTANHTLAYDTGPPFGASADSGNRVVAPFLRAVGVRRLDGLIVSHDDIDHTGGAVSVMHAVPVGWLATSLHDMDPLPLVANEAFRCEAGQTWTWDDVRFEILHPDRAVYGSKLKDNNLSCVLKVVAPGGTVLIPGDVERRAEDLLLARGRPLAADVLVAPHQGSKTSSTQAFVDAVRPKAVVFPVGYRNRFGHPHAEVVERYRKIESEIYRTDRDGAVLITITPEGNRAVTRWRETYRRYWLDSPLRHESEPLNSALMTQ